MTRKRVKARNSKRDGVQGWLCTHCGGWNMYGVWYAAHHALSLTATCNHCKTRHDSTNYVTTK